VVKEFGIAPNDICALQKMEWSKLLETGNAVAAKINLAMRGFMFRPPSSPGRVPRVGWTPTFDGRVITLKSFDDTAPEVSKNAPMLIGSVSKEGMRYKSDPTGIDRPPGRN
jgi:para-nitrobenzyl esterase